MLYCEDCSVLYDENTGRRAGVLTGKTVNYRGNAPCPFCHRHFGRAPKADDLCFLTEQPSLWSDVLADMLRDAGVPAMRKQSVGVAPLIGSNLARYRFYTPYARFADAQQVLDDLLAEDEDEGSEDQELEEFLDMEEEFEDDDME